MWYEGTRIAVLAYSSPKYCLQTMNYIVSFAWFHKQWLQDARIYFLLNPWEASVVELPRLAQLEFIDNSWTHNAVEHYSWLTKFHLPAVPLGTVEMKSAFFTLDFLGLVVGYFDRKALHNTESTCCTFCMPLSCAIRSAPFIPRRFSNRSTAHGRMNIQFANGRDYPHRGFQTYFDASRPDRSRLVPQKDIGTRGPFQWCFME